MGKGDSSLIIMPNINPRVHVLKIKRLTSWNCDSCDHIFPVDVEAIEVTIGPPPKAREDIGVRDTDLLFLCPVCARQLGRNLHKVGSQADKRQTKELKEDFHG